MFDQTKLFQSLADLFQIRGEENQKETIIVKYTFNGNSCFPLNYVYICNCELWVSPLLIFLYQIYFIFMPSCSCIAYISLLTLSLNKMKSFSKYTTLYVTELKKKTFYNK